MYEKRVVPAAATPLPSDVTGRGAAGNGTSVMRGSTDGTCTTATMVSRRPTFSFSRCMNTARLRLRLRR